MVFVLCYTEKASFGLHSSLSGIRLSRVNNSTVSDKEGLGQFYYPSYFKMHSLLHLCPLEDMKVKVISDSHVDSMSLFIAFICFPCVYESGIYFLNKLRFCALRVGGMVQ